MRDNTSAEPSEPSTARPGHNKSFQQVAETARQALRDRGLSEDEIEQELQRITRPEK